MQYKKSQASWVEKGLEKEFDYQEITSENLDVGWIGGIAHGKHIADRAHPTIYKFSIGSSFP